MSTYLKEHMQTRNSNQRSTSNTKVQKPALVKHEVKPDPSWEEGLQIPDSPTDKPPSAETTENVAIWLKKKRETTRTNIAMWLVRTFGCSLGITFLIVGLAAFNPKADKTFIKDILPSVLTSQTVILGVTARYYFRSTKEQ